MKCQVCGEADATIHFKELKNEEMHELHLCPGCAEEKGFHSLVEQDQASFSSQLIWMAENLYPEGGTKIGAVQCDRCGLRYSEFTRSGRLGCMHCYTAFDVQIRRLLRRVHGSTRHTGKTPGRPKGVSTRRAALHRLQEQLQRAIATEDYEQAAKIRDEIRSLESTSLTEGPKS